MYLIVGLGNPGKEYEKTRHNVGYDTIDKIVNEIEEKSHIKLEYKNKFNGKYIKTKLNNEEVILLKPETYMNLSGESIKEYVSFFKIEEENILIIYDDKDINKEEIRIRNKGNSAGHNGIKSIQNYFNNFVRIRIGIDKPIFKENMVNYVIGKVPNSEYEKLSIGINKAKEAVYSILEQGIEKTMNAFNNKKKKNEDKLEINEDKKGEEI